MSSHAHGFTTHGFKKSEFLSSYNQFTIQNLSLSNKHQYIIVGLFNYHTAGIDQYAQYIFQITEWYSDWLDQQINEEDAQPDPQHSVPDLDFNIKIVDDEKKVNQISSDNPTVAVSNQQANQSAIEPLPMQTNRPRCLVQLFHCLFKGLAILFFFLLNMVIQDETITFVLIVIFDAFDFWTVKNISGRKLVGLRWWSEIKEDGVEVWQYESMQANFEPNDCNSSVFWFSQVISVLVWLVLTLVYLISFHWFWALLCITGVILCGLNLFGFYKCRGQHQKKAKLYMAKIGLKALQGSM